ncbi:hypothetical protein [Flaviflagellibacter deserti]|uniref:Uncharacterized protein n=1 Tax=Flaviflagellibacter deserti TaxID=2267266 RepID=A0ABV9Z1N4_9HYPH
MNPTPEQGRILTILQRANGRWVSMRWLDTTPLLFEDDFPVVPSLIENGWAQHKLRSIQITPEGIEALERASAPVQRDWPPNVGGLD